MRPGYHHQNIIYPNPAGVQWHHPQGVPYQQHIGHGYTQPPPNHIPNQSQNPRPQTPPSAAPTATQASVPTGGIPPGTGVQGHPTMQIGTGQPGQQQHQMYSAGSHTPAHNTPQFTPQQQQQVVPQPHGPTAPVSVSTQQTVTNLPNATVGQGHAPGVVTPQAQAPVFMPSSRPAKRERKGIQIIDPNTGQPIDLTGDSTSTTTPASSSVTVSRSSPASVVPNVDVSESSRPNIDNEDVSEVYMNY